jgi:superfamily II DNA or RNA helicase
MSDLSHLEFHRSGIGLAPCGRGQEGAAVHVEEVPGLSTPVRSCPCGDERRADPCQHLRDVSRAVLAFRERYRGRRWAEVFEATPWARLAAVLSEVAPVPLAHVETEAIAGPDERPAGLRFRGRAPRSARSSAGRSASGPTAEASREPGPELGRWLGDGEPRFRLLERLGLIPEGYEGSDRAGVLHRLALFQWTKQERLLAKAGMPSRRQSLEGSFWYRFAYHAVRELGTDGTRFQPAVDRGSGRFALLCRPAEPGAGEGGGEADADPVAELTLPRGAVERVLRVLAEIFPRQADLRIRPIPLKTIFHVSAATEIDGGEAVDVRPVVQAIQALQVEGEERVIEQAEVERFVYGRLIYLEELGVLAELERPGRERRFGTPRRLRLERSRVPSFLDDHREGIETGTVAFEGLLAERRLFREAETVRIDRIDTEEAEGRSWYWLAVHYGFGASSVSLARILEARRRGEPYLEMPDGWIDLRAPGFRHLDRLLDGRGEGEGEGEGADGGGRLRLSAAELLRLQAGAGRSVVVADRAGEAGGGDGAGGIEAARERAERLRRVVELRPAGPYEQPAGLATPLRAYQERGVEWLRFLWENRLGGILADDMGLGKTHQSMALMAHLRAAGVAEPFLVVCPTSVMSHWRDKLRSHAPGLRAVVHHGPGRDLGSAVADGGVVVTSYGVLRRDEEELAAVPWGLALYDEIQNLKNRATRGWRAAARVPATVRLGLTGTPIENSLTDLEVLFALVLPGYLGSARDFEERYGGDEPAGRERLEELRRLVSPFVLRRTKAAVLAELPEKIEDVRTARLSEDQVKLYREAVGSRGRDLARRITGGAEPVPYIHVFALLNLLKQICDHPALALRETDRPDALTRTASGKWELYRELLSECLDSGLSVVVFSQYLGMIDLMARDLEERGVGFVTLTGSSRDRGAIVDRFNRDPECRVFLGSLKAGGTGIDLVGGSVVIHYDRWWNAAREDQATDRVHRIGQHRAVQVFKLVTEGTLEEKIHAMIERKRAMMHRVVREDNHRLAKVFSRDELLELLAEPEDRL